MHRGFRELNPQVRFLHNWHNELIAAKLEACFRGEVKRLIINVPPRSLKSHAAAIAFPAYVLGHNPSAQIIADREEEWAVHDHFESALWLRGIADKYCMVAAVNWTDRHLDGVLSKLRRRDPKHILIRHKARRNLQDNDITG
jgi:hypothetical protein